MKDHVAEHATGCLGAGNYRDVAKANGYPHLYVWDWTSSAGDWSFLVSKDGKEWIFMTQQNRYPYEGYAYSFDTDGPHFFADNEDDLYALVQEELERR